MMFNNFRKIIKLKNEIEQLKTENSILKYRNKALVELCEDKNVGVTTIIEDQIEEAIIANNAAHEKRYKNLSIKTETIKDDYENRKRNLEKLQSEMDEILIYLEKLNIKVTPQITRENEYHKEKMKNALNTKEDIEKGITFLSRKLRHTAELLEKLE